MSAISTYLEYIRSKIYAKDVRTAIVNAISQCYDDVNKPALQTEAMRAAVQAKIDAGQMAAYTVADGSFAGSKLANGAVTTAKIADSAVTWQKLASGAVHTGELADSAVTNVKLADSSVSEEKLASSAVKTTKLADGAVTNTKLGDASVTTAKIANGAITKEKLSNDIVFETDKTLSISDMPADAKVVGDEIADLKSDLSETENEIIRTAGVVEELECGLTEEVKAALLACFAHVAWISDDGQTYYDALSNALNRSRVLSSIRAVFTQGSTTIYDTDELYALKQYLTVTVTYSDGTTKEVNNYTLSGKLVAGTNTITVAYNKKTTTFNVIVTHQAKTLESISATFNPSASITTDNVLDDLRPYLTVRASYSDGSTNTITNYTLSGSLNVGANTITVAYNNKTATFTVNVTEAQVVLQSISASFNQGSTVIYTDNTLNDLKPYLTITARYSNGTTQTVTNYTLSGTLTKGTSTITASYGGKTATFNVTVSERSATLQSITATFNQGSAVIYTDSSLNDLKPYLVVTASYSDGTTQTVTNYTLSGTLTKGTSTITASYGGKTATFNVTVSERSATLQSITATFTQGSTVIYTDSSLNDLKPYLVVTANYSDSSTQTVTGYTLSGTLAAGESTITASYGGMTDTFSVTVTDSSTPIPSGYTLKSYVQSNGDAYIDTGYILIAGTTSVPFTKSFEGKFAVSAVSENKDLFGYQGTAGGEVSVYRFMAFIKADDDNLYYYGKGSGVSSAVQGWEPSGINDISVYFDGYYVDYPTFIINGVQTTGDKQRPLTYSSVQGTVYLCAQNYKASGPAGSDTTVDGGYIRCYEFKIRELEFSTGNETVVMNFKPCVRNSDGVAGFYETVNGVFYPSIGKNAFVAGD